MSAKSSLALAAILAAVASSALAADDTGRSSEAPRANWTAGPVPVLARMPVAVETIAAGRSLDLPRPSAIATVPPEQFDLTQTPAARSGSWSATSAQYGAVPAPGAVSSGIGGRIGAVTPERTDLPSYFFKERVVAPHLSPDIEIGLNERSSLGFYGEVVHTAREDVRNNTVRETRDLGAGVSFQYKFNSR